MAPIKLSRDKPPYDEQGLSDEDLATCPECGQLYPADSWHRCETNAIGDVPSDIEAAWEQ